jgi:exopolysaccharide biosynthesis protein
MGSLHYVVVTANTEEPNYSIPTVAEFGRRLLEMGVPTAYALDGGQTAAIVMNNQLINTVSYGSQREISDIIYFATAMPERGE